MTTLPGFDLWRTTPPGDAPEPSQRHIDDARDELPEDAGEDEIYALACRMLAKEVQDSHDDAAIAAAESREDDLMNREGDGPL